MPVKVAYELIAAPRTKSFAEFLDENNLSVTVKEMADGFLADFKPLTEKCIGSAGVVLRSIWVWGKTPDAAITRLAKDIRGCKLRISCAEGPAKYVTCPNHWREV